MANMHVLKNLMWRFFERCGAQGVTFLVSIVLARLLDPSVYGTIALVTVFTVIMQVFIDSGLGNALIQKKDADDLDFSTVFYFNLATCILLYAAMYFAAPAIAAFYKMPELTAVVRVLSLTLVISGVKNIQQAYVSRNMLFKRFFFATLGGTLGAAVVGIWMAIRGYGVWALVAQHLFNAAVDTMILWITVKWRPRWLFSWKRLKKLLSFGWKLLVSALLDTIYNNLRQLIIGKMYTPSDLAYYNRGKQFPSLIISNINTSIDSVLLPTMAAEQDNQRRLRMMTQRSIQTSTYIMAPLMIGLACIAEPMIRLLLTEKWLDTVLFLRIYCFVYLLYPINTANLNALKAMGRSDLFLKLEIAKKLVGLTLLGTTMWFGVEVMAYSSLLAALLGQMINAWPNRKLLNYQYLEQMKDVLPSAAMAVVMGIFVYCVGFFGWNDLITIAAQIVLGAVIYIAESCVFRNDTFFYLLAMLRPMFKKRGKNR